MDPTLTTLLVIAIAAMIAPILVDAIPKPRMPLVVIEILLGIVVGPQFLGWAEPTEFVLFLKDFGIAFLFFMAGYEIDFERLEGSPIKLAVKGWLAGLLVGLGFGLVLQAMGVTDSFLYITIAISTTAIGTLMPILKDSGDTESSFGRYMLAAGAVGEFGPIVLIALFLEPERGSLASGLVLSAFSLVVICGLYAARKWTPNNVVTVMHKTMKTSGQLAMRISVALVIGFVVLAIRMHLEFLLGAFAAGVLAGQAMKRVPAEDHHAVEALLEKYEGLGFGFLIPIFFVTSGITFDGAALLHSPTSLALLPVFLAAFLLVRAAPVLLLYRGVLTGDERRALGLFGATQLPLVIAVTSLGVESERMPVDIATSLVGAAMISVMLFPLTALSFRARSRVAVQVTG